MKRRKILILLSIVGLLLLSFCACTTTQSCDLNRNNIKATFNELLEHRKIDIDDCNISDPPMLFDIAWESQTGEVSFMLCGIAVDSHEYKEQTFTIEYDDSVCSLHNGNSMENLNDAVSLNALLDFIESTDFSVLYQNDSQNSAYCELKTGGIYEDFNGIAGSGIRDDYRLYIFENRTFYDFDKYEGDLSRCIGIFFSTYSSVTGDLTGNTNVLILYK